jgi:hypothetical protein
MPRRTPITRCSRIAQGVLEGTQHIIHIICTYSYFKPSYMSMFFAMHWQGGVLCIGHFWFGLRGYSHSLILSLGLLIYFYLFAYHSRLLAHSIAMPLRCHHKLRHQIKCNGMGPTSIGASHPLPDGLLSLFFHFHYLLFFLSSFFTLSRLSCCSLRDVWVAWHSCSPSISLRYRLL